MVTAGPEICENSTALSGCDFQRNVATEMATAMLRAMRARTVMTARRGFRANPILRSSTSSPVVEAFNSMEYGKAPEDASTAEVCFIHDQNRDETDYLMLFPGLA